jgi:hypothetical protein
MLPVIASSANAGVRNNFGIEIKNVAIALVTNNGIPTETQCPLGALTVGRALAIALGKGPQAEVMESRKDGCSLSTQIAINASNLRST